MKNRWLDRSLIVSRCYYTLCTTQKQFDREMRKTEAGRTRFPDIGAATFLYSYKGKDLAVVALSDYQERTPIQIAGLLVHEATHIWQHWCKLVGEKRPGDETEAYAIQWLSQELMEEFVRQTSKKKRK